MLWVFALNAKATITITNGAYQATIYVRLYCHDASYSSCGSILSTVYPIAPNSSIYFGNTNELYPCSVANVTNTYTPSSSQNWDGIIFEINDGVNVSINGKIDRCNSETYWVNWSMIIPISCDYSSDTNGNSFYNFGNP